ncbi:relaxase/mobilization nuclease domain-containing protein [Salmonella enterica]|nr:relaxase/mobilization nuclease domain-containing protein [Salmonella enterica]
MSRSTTNANPFTFQGFDSTTELLRGPVKAKKAPSDKRPNSGGGGLGAGADAITNFLKRAAAVSRRTPEAMVRITGAAKGKDHVKEHLAYITRNGKLDATNERGETISGRQAVKDVAEEWTSAGLATKGPDTRNVMLSMPKGTDPDKVLRAAKTFADKTFGGERQYMIALHTDKDHPHVHLTLKREGFDGKNLNPRKADLQEWREGFAHELRALGVAAEATPRRARGVVKKSQKQAVYQIQHKRAGRADVATRSAWRLVEHGAAPYQDKPNAKGSYFVKLESDNGKIRKVWGVDLERAVSESGAKIGDRIKVEHIGAVTVQLPDGQTAERNGWQIQVSPDQGEAVHKPRQSTAQLQKYAEAVREITGNAAPKVRPWEMKIRERQEKIRGAWLHTAGVLDKHPSEEAKQLAKQIRQFVKDMPPVQTERQQIHAQVAKGLGRGVGKQPDKGVDRS